VRSRRAQVASELQPQCGQQVQVFLTLSQTCVLTVWIAELSTRGRAAD
jgi:hypothetical protein